MLGAGQGEGPGQAGHLKPHSVPIVWPGSFSLLMALFLLRCGLEDRGWASAGPTWLVPGLEGRWQRSGGFLEVRK